MQATATAFNYGAASKVLNAPYYTVRTRAYDVSRDGQKFLMIKEGRRDAPAGAPPTSMVVVLNWLAELEARIPKK